MAHAVFLSVWQEVQGLGNLVFLSHRGRNEPESMRMHESARRSFCFECRHVASDALAPLTAILRVGVFFEGSGARTVR
jgi:hypothetical protein